MGMLHNPFVAVSRPRKLPPFLASSDPSKATSGRGTYCALSGHPLGADLRLKTDNVPQLFLSYIYKTSPQPAMTARLRIFSRVVRGCRQVSRPSLWRDGVDLAQTYGSTKKWALAVWCSAKALKSPTSN